VNTINTIRDFQAWRQGISGSLGFVPTMGALHGGHLSLVEKSIKMCMHTVVSIYLNPTQFSSDEDIETYPQNLKHDLESLSQFQVDVIFLPTDSEMYPLGFSTYVKETILSMVLEGKSRPVFFQGVATVVTKLFNIVRPTHAFFGIKDAQQLLIIKKIVKDMAYPIDIIDCPIVRENNGIAMSSRNRYLSLAEHKIATNIYKALQDGENLIISGERDAQIIREKITRTINQEDVIRIDYISVADAETLIEISG
ncbi:uncharacterized protein METZ01_LOCUS327442, partial [marine metagenome]